MLPRKTERFGPCDPSSVKNALKVRSAGLRNQHSRRVRYPREDVTESVLIFSDDIRAGTRSSRHGLRRPFDNLTRQLYATDASIYQIQPAGAAFPKTAAEASAVIRTAADTNVSITPRGAGTSLSGGAIGEGLIVDFSRHNRQISELDIERRRSCASALESFWTSSTLLSIHTDSVSGRTWRPVRALRSAA